MCLIAGIDELERVDADIGIKKFRRRYMKKVRVKRCRGCGERVAVVLVGEGSVVPDRCHWSGQPRQCLGAADAMRLHPSPCLTPHVCLSVCLRVRQNLPVMIQGLADEWPAMKKWTLKKVRRRTWLAREGGVWERGWGEGLIDLDVRRRPIIDGSGCLFRLSRNVLY